jgi:hypothetical protein
MIDYESLAMKAYQEYESSSNKDVVVRSNMDNALIEHLHAVHGHLQQVSDQQASHNQQLMQALTKPKRKKVVRNASGDIEQVIEE